MENASLGSFMYVVRRRLAIRGCLMRLPGSGGYYTSASSSSEASPPSRPLKRILVAQWVSGMYLIEVYIVRAEAPEARLAARDDVLAREADVVRTVAHREADLRGEDQLVPHALYGPARDLLREALLVDVGGVYEVAAGLPRGSGR